jgi:hypothetical protein
MAWLPVSSQRAAERGGERRRSRLSAAAAAMPASRAATLVRVTSALLLPSTVASAACSPVAGSPASAATVPAAKTFVCLPCSARSSGVAFTLPMLKGMVFALDLAMLCGVTPDCGSAAAMVADDGFSLGVLFKDYRTSTTAPGASKSSLSEIESQFEVCG